MGTVCLKLTKPFILWVLRVKFNKKFALAARTEIETEITG